MLKRAPLPIISLMFLLMAGSATAMSATFNGASLHGATGTLDITETTTDGTYSVVWSLDPEGYEGSATNHPYLTDIGFKAFHSVSSVSLVSIAPGGNTADDPLLGGISNSGCTAGSSGGFVCTTNIDPMIEVAGATEMIEATFLVEGDLMDGGWSFKGKYGEGNGWVISESAAPVPEPSAALVFGLGLVTVGMRLRREAALA